MTDIDPTPAPDGAREALTRDEIEALLAPWPCCEHCSDDPMYHAENPPDSHDVPCRHCLMRGYAATLASPAPPPPAGTEALREALDELRQLTTCRCHEDWTERGLHQTDCVAEYRSDVETLALATAQPGSAPADGEVEATAGNVAILQRGLTVLQMQRDEARARAEEAERRLADVLRDAAATLEGCAEGCDPLPFADTLRGVAQAYRDAAAALPGTDTSDDGETT